MMAVLGPTNTGKTHLAIERMLGHASGMIGFPLRLLARENYDRLVSLKGRGRVALVTGEEKIIPPNPSWWVCTVESMPLERPVDFLAVDEIQLAADPERGHVFTHRLLHARGLEETMVMGADTIRPLIRRLTPEAEIITRPRLSRLTFAGSRKLSRLPPRSAVVAFSADDVYRLAEQIRRQRGGAAVVLGALSPRTRNAQVAMYQAGEVDYLVATDAIGMGLNMDIDHVAFARLSKFDGARSRRLMATEIAQIAGRAGRHMSDGTFGVATGALDREAPAIDPETIERIESHSFEPLTRLMWRQARLDFDSPRALLASLDSRPPDPALARAPEAEDQRTLAALIRDPAVAALAVRPDRVRLLWQVAQVPDFRKILSDQHVRLLAEIYGQLARAGRLDRSWVAGHVARLDRVDGDIDALVMRLAHIRTWTFIAHRGQWLDETTEWQARTRAIEDRLSDALHERLTQRFVDRRASILGRRMAGDAWLAGNVDAGGDVAVEGEHVGRLEGFAFHPDSSVPAQDRRRILAAARRALKPEIGQRLARLEAAPDESIQLDSTGGLSWEGARLARFVAGPVFLDPLIEMLDGALLEAGDRERAAERLRRWWTAHRARLLSPLMALADPALMGAARGIAFQLYEGYGAQPRPVLRTLIAALTRADRRALAAHGVRIGALHVFTPALLKPKRAALLHLLWGVAHDRASPPPPPPPGAVSTSIDPEVAEGFYRAAGFAPLGGRAVRLDRIEALSDAVERRLKAGPVLIDGALAQLIGAPLAALPDVLRAMGYRSITGPDGREAFQRAKSRRRPAPRAADGGPFARLAELVERP